MAESRSLAQTEHELAAEGDEEEEEEDRHAQDRAEDSTSEDGDTSESASESSGSDSDDSAPGGCLGGAPKKRKPVLVPKNTPFCHQGCCVRSSALVLSMVLLAFAGRGLRSLSPLVGDAALTVGPTSIILTYFYLRFNFSTTRRQLLITFAETVFWMVPLLAVIGHIDFFSSKLTNRDVSVSCVWESYGVGGRLVGVLSWGAQCALEAANGTASPIVSWSGIPCPEDRDADIELVSSDGFIPTSILKEFFNLSTHSAAPASCDPLDLVMDDAVNGIRVTSIARGKRVVPVDSRLSLAKAHDAVYNASHLGRDGAEEVEIDFWLRKKTILHAFVQAYFRAGFLEELLKYIAVRRVLFKDRVVDCGGLVAYGLAAGAGFATAENVQYALIYGASVTYVRMLFSIPLHCCTGLIIGVHLGYRKFLGQKCFCLVALIVPVFVHGTYDFLLMAPESVGGSEWRMLLVPVMLIFSFLYCRCAWLLLDNVCMVDVRSMMRARKVSQPRVCCLERDCLSVWFVHQDPLLQQPPAAVQPAPGRTQSAGSSVSSTSSISRLAHSVTREVLPDEPPCQTRPTSCPNCRSGVRMHILYESFCPHCGARMPDPTLPAATPSQLRGAPTTRDLAMMMRP